MIRRVANHCQMKFRPLHPLNVTIFTASGYVRAAYVMARLSDRLLSQFCVLSKRLNAGSRRQRHTLDSSDAEDLGEIRTKTESLPTAAPIGLG